MSWLQTDDEGEAIPLTIVDKANAWCKEMAAILWVPGAEATAAQRSSAGAGGGKAAQRNGAGKMVRASESSIGGGAAEGARAPSDHAPATGLRLFLQQLVTAAREEDEVEDDEEGTGAYQRLHSRSSKQVEIWSKAWLLRVKNLRNCERKTMAGLTTSIQRSTGAILFSFLVKHETFRSAARLSLPNAPKYAVHVESHDSPPPAVENRALRIARPRIVEPHALHYNL